VISTATNPKVLAGATIVGLIGGLKYIKGSIVPSFLRKSRKKVPYTIEMADAKDFRDYKDMPYCCDKCRPS
jgi:hypothetical protein